MRLPAAARALVVSALVVSAGCTSLVDRGDDAPGGASTGVEDCQHHRLSGNTSEGPWQAAWVECHATVGGSTRQTLRCTEPSRATLTASANLTGGHVVLRVRDGDDALVAEETVEDTGGDPRNVSMGAQGADPGTWTLTGERSAGFDGTYEAELWCPSG